MVLKAVSDIGGGADSAAVDLDVPLLEAGVDSLAATELSARLRAVTNVALSPMLAFEQPTPRAIAVHIIERGAAKQRPTRPARRSTRRRAARLEQVDAAVVRLTAGEVEP